MSAILFVVLRATTGAALPVWDASTTAFSLVAQWMMNEKLVENWLLWLAVDIVYVPIYAVRSYNLTAALYAIFCLLAWKGYVDWKRSAKEIRRQKSEIRDDGSV
jgi:nicotinamide mononucleotide transporter